MSSKSENFKVILVREMLEKGKFNGQEIWIPLEGYDNDYSISTLGVIKYEYYRRNIKKTGVLNSRIDSTGRVYVILRRNNKSIRKYPANLLAYLILGSVKHAVIAYKDGNKQNLAVDNIIWDFTNCKVTKEDADSIRSRYADNLNSAKELAAMFNVSIRTIYRVIAEDRNKQIAVDLIS